MEVAGDTIRRVIETPFAESQNHCKSVRARPTAWEAAVIHVPRQWKEASRDDHNRVLALTGIEKTCSNCVDRSTVVSRVHTLFPHLAPWGRSLSPFRTSAFGRRRADLMRTKGVQQGDPWARHSSHWPPTPSSRRPSAAAGLAYLSRPGCSRFLSRRRG